MTARRWDQPRLCNLPRRCCLPEGKWSILPLQIFPDDQQSESWQSGTETNRDVADMLTGWLASGWAGTLPTSRKGGSGDTTMET